MSTRILLIKLSALGDVIQTLPTLEAIRAVYPAAEISWLVEEEAAPVLASHPALDNLLISRRKTWLAAWRRPGERRIAWQQCRHLVQTLRRQSYDVVVDLQGLAKSAFWTMISRSPRKIGFDRSREYSYLALTERLPPYDPDEHAIRRYLGVARYLGAAGEPVRFRLALPTGTGNDVAYLWQEKSGPLIIMHPGTRWPTKFWRPESFASLADALIHERQARVVFTGSRSDRSLIAGIRSCMASWAEDLSGRTDLKTLARLFYQANAAVTTDTGPMHLAAAVGTPVAAVFGPTAPWRTGPYGARHRVIRTKVSCSPCFRRQCPNPKCLTDLGVPEVLAAVNDILDRAIPGAKPPLPRRQIHGQVCEIIEHVA
jgi:lipopolysaccharide heptosyltransferase I